MKKNDNNKGRVIYDDFLILNNVPFLISENNYFFRIKIYQQKYEEIKIKIVSI